MITYSERADALYIELQEGAEVTRTTPLDDLRIVDYAADDSVIGVEFLDASAGLDLKDLPERAKLESAVKALSRFRILT